mmetsp:Transcript_81058/g.153834  ORF Transcript_81058/g.153834 Transcript_81058/m.153834 type:complete len:359 (-) Transcript_81058:62-1138(-)
MALTHLPAILLVCLICSGLSRRLNFETNRLGLDSRWIRSRNSAVRCSAVPVDSASAPMLCTPGTLSSRIEKAVCSVYGAAGTERVRLSLKRLSDGERLNRRVDETHELMMQEANSYIEDLTPRPWYDASQHKWAQQLEKKWTVVRDELQSRLADEATLKATGQNVWGSLDESIVEYGTGWKTLPLCDRTVWDPVNSALFPKTCEVLHKCKVPLIEAFFAKMEPESDIKPHSDMCNFVLTSHLGLIVPEGQCEITVGNETNEWKNGQVMMFDTSILHAAENRAKTERHILMLRVYHPELTRLERSALQLVFDCLDEQELLDDQEALAEYEIRRRAIEAESRKPWEEAAAQSKGKRKKRR